MTAPLALTLAICDMPSGNRAYTLDATPDELGAISADLGLIACRDLHAAYAIRALGGGRYKLTGSLAAHVTQACVVTLEPVENALKIPLDVTFSPTPAEAAPASEDDEIEVFSLPDIEPIENGQLAVGRVIFEALAAGIDPYPRAGGATFAWDDPRASDSLVHPFAGLAKLKLKE